MVGLIVIGLPFGYLTYNDTKWKLLGYKAAAKGIVTYALWVAILVYILSPFNTNIPTWVGFALLISLYVWFIVSTVYYHNLKERYEDDKNSKLPKMDIIRIVKEEEKLDKAVAENNRVSKTKSKSNVDDIFDNGL